MNSRELISNMISKDQVNRIAVYEGFWDDTLEIWVEQGYPTEKIMQNGLERIVPVDPFHHFTYDLHRCGGFFDTDPIFGYEEILEETSEWVIRRDGAGATQKLWKNKSGTPGHIDFKMTSRDIWEREYRPHLLQLEQRRFNGKWWGENSLEEDKREFALARSRNQWAWVGHVFVWEVMRQSVGDLIMLKNILLDPGWIHDFNRVYTDFFIEHFKAMFEEIGIPDCVWLFDDIAYKNGLFASPEVLHDLYLPYYAEIVSFFNNEYGLPVFFHSDGKLEQALPIIIEAGFVGLHPLERKAGNDPIAIADKYGDQLVLIGGLDVQILETNDRDHIASEIKQLLEAMKTREASYIFHSDHTIPPTVDYDTYRFALDTYMQYRDF